jgi:hypothetical protein
LRSIAESRNLIRETLVDRDSLRKCDFADAKAPPIPGFWHFPVNFALGERGKGGVVAQRRKSPAFARE